MKEFHIHVHIHIHIHNDIHIHIHIHFQLYFLKSFYFIANLEIFKKRILKNIKKKF